MQPLPKGAAWDWQSEGAYSLQIYCSPQDEMEVLKALSWYTGGLFIALYRPERNFLHMVPKTECTKMPLKSTDSIEQAPFCISFTPRISGFQILTQLYGRGNMVANLQPIQLGTGTRERTQIGRQHLVGLSMTSSSALPPSPFSRTGLKWWQIPFQNSQAALYIAVSRTKALHEISSLSPTAFDAL